MAKEKLAQAEATLKIACDDFGYPIELIKSDDKARELHEMRCKVASYMYAIKDGANRRFTLDIIAEAMNKSKTSVYYMVNPEKKSAFYKNNRKKYYF